MAFLFTTNASTDFGSSIQRLIPPIGVDILVCAGKYELIALVYFISWL
jgi:hypothetical protein